MSDEKSEARPPIQWHAMTRRWWFEAAIKVALIVSIIVVVRYIAGDVLDSLPRWGIGITLLLGVIALVPLVPFPPREGEHHLTVAEGVQGVGIVLAVLIGMAVALAILIAIFVGMNWLSSIIAPIMERIFSRPTFWLAVIAVLLLLIYLRLLDRPKGR